MPNAVVASKYSGISGSAENLIDKEITDAEYDMIPECGMDLDASTYTDWCAALWHTEIEEWAPHRGFTHLYYIGADWMP